MGVKGWPASGGSVRTKGLAGLLVLAGWISGNPPALKAQSGGLIRGSGSSTVGPITALAIRGFTASGQRKGADFKPVVENGTSAGFREFCAGKTSISHASRPMNGQELRVCKAAGGEFYELPIGFDAITVVVHPDNTWARDITLTELKRLWSRSAQGRVNQWNQIRPSWPRRPVKLYSPGRDSGIFDYFTKAITGEQGNARSDVIHSENDNSLAKGVASHVNTLGYFGFSYYKANTNMLRALAVVGTKGRVMPSLKTVQNETYQPLARPIFLYVNAQQFGNKPALKSFVQYYINNASNLVSQAGSVPLSDSQYRLVQNKLFRHVLGSAFAGDLPVGLPLGQLLNRSIDANKKPQFRL